MNKPKAPAEKVRRLAGELFTKLLGVPRPPLFPSYALAVRSYFRDTMGVRGRNDVGIYDDGLFIVRADDVVLPFNANLDPSRIGINGAIGKPFAQLATGLWYFREGLHKGKVAAWRQPDTDEAEALELPNNYEIQGDGAVSACLPGLFSVWRDPGDGRPPYHDLGYHAINIHPGGNYGTSSWGCLTLPPSQADEWLRESYAATRQQRRAMDSAKHRVLPVLLMDGPIN